MLHTWQKSYNLRRNEENLAAKLLNISGEILTAKLKDLGANLIIDLFNIVPGCLILPFYVFVPSFWMKGDLILIFLLFYLSWFFNL